MKRTPDIGYLNRQNDTFGDLSNRWGEGMDGVKLQASVDALLAACYASDDPVATLHAELDRLRASGEWSHLEFRQLQVVALQTVKMIADSRAGA